MANVFIGSSSEAVEIARVVGEVLRDLGAGTTGWWYRDAFHAGETIIEGIERLAASHDAALLLATTDDQTVVRGQVQVKPRDNLIFEAGFFAARYGRRRAPVVCVGSPTLPTDLNGVIHLDLPPRKAATPARYGEEIRPILAGWLEGLDSGGAKQTTTPRAALLPYAKDSPRWRLAASDEVINRCHAGDLVRFIAVTGHALFAREPRQAERLVFIEALKRGVRFEGVVMDPASEQAKLRGSVETPGAPAGARLIDRDARSMQDWLTGGFRTRISEEQRRNIAVKRSADLVSFGLLMFEEVAFVEVLHLGKLDELEHLCGYSVIEAPRGSHDYEIARRHFELLFARGTPVE